MSSPGRWGIYGINACAAVQGWGLVIETAGPSLQVGLLENGEPAGGIRWDGKNQHGEKLIPLTRQLLLESRLSWQQIRYAVYHQGPGSHTGLRIGLAAVKAWALSLGWEVYAAPLLHVLHTTAREQGVVGKVFTFWQARPGEWYGQIWWDTVSAESPVILPAEEWRRIADDACWIGNRSEAHYHVADIPWQAVARAARSLKPLQSLDEIIALTPLYFRAFIPTQRKK